MNVRDAGTAWYIDLERVKNRLDNMENCEDISEMIAICQELSADIDSTMYDIDKYLELNMEEE